jgi:hypothetical protein
MKNLTTSQLIEKAKSYDRIQNEGGEGYNPYRNEMERRELEERAARPKTKQDEINTLHKKIEVECGSVAREWGNEEADKKQAEYYAQIRKLEAEVTADEESTFSADWTLEATQSRRAEWNGFIRGLMDSKGQIAGKDQPKVYQREMAQGWKLADLKKAIKLHNL